MRNIFSIRAFMVACVAVAAGLLFSDNVLLWLPTLLTLPLLVWILGGRHAHTVLLWVIGIIWLSVAADILHADLTGMDLEQAPLGEYRVSAIWWSLAALIAITVGMRLGGGLADRAASTATAAQAAEEQNISIGRSFFAYAVSLVFVQSLGALAAAVPSLTQPIGAFALVKFVLIYIVAARVFDANRGYGWLAALALCELVSGSVGFFAAYKEAFFVIVIAFAAKRRRFSVPMVAASVICVVTVIWVSLIWSSIKTDYRYWVSGYTNAQTLSRPLGERLQWIGDRLSQGETDYADAAEQLIDRIGYTQLFSIVMYRVDTGYVTESLDRYYSAVQHILTPRVLFPNKGSLNDSTVTMALTGLSINDNTSIGVGFIAEAYADFGAPGMLVPLALVGLLLGLCARYFMTRRVPLLVRHAFTTATIFISFKFETDIDKSLGAFITGWLAMALLLRFGYPMIAYWLIDPGSRLKVKRAALGDVPS